MTRAHVVAVGAVSAAGGTALATVMGLRASRTEPRGVDERDHRGARIGVFRAFRAGAQRGTERLATLAAAAFADACAGGARPRALVLVVPERVAQAELATALAPALGAGCTLELVPGDAAAFASALERALTRLGRDDTVAVGGVDSDLDPERLAQLAGERRIFSRAQDGGVVPGEGAAVVVLGARRQGALAAVESVEDAEDAAIRRGEPPIGAALTSLVRGSARAAAHGPFGWVLLDEAGERAGAREWDFACFRNREVLLVPPYVDRPALALGRLGAAAGPMLVVLAAGAWGTGAAPAPEALALLGSDGPTRAALVLNAGEGADASFRASATTARAHVCGGRAPLDDDTRRALRACLRDIGSVGQLADVADTEPWITAQPFEERLLRAYDAFAAYALDADPADIASVVERFADELTVFDRMRAFACVFVRASIPALRARGPIVVAPDDAHRAPGYDWLERALALSALPDAELAGLATSTEAGIAAAALGAGARRGAGAIGAALACLAHPDADLRRAAARALGTAADPETAAVSARALGERADLERDERTALAIAESLLTLGARRGLELAREHVDADAAAPGTIAPVLLERWLALVGLVGARRDTERLERALERAPLAAATGAGLHGRAELVEPLLARLDELGRAREAGAAQAPDQAALAVARALARLLGKEPRRQVQLPELSKDDPRGRRELCVESGVWRMLAADLGPSLPSGRIRRGGPHDLSAVLAELAAPATLSGDRRALRIEAALLAPSTRSLPRSGVAREKQAIAKIDRGGAPPASDSLLELLS